MIVEGAILLLAAQLMGALPAPTSAQPAPPPAFPSIDEVATTPGVSVASPPTPVADGAEIPATAQAMGTTEPRALLAPSVLGDVRFASRDGLKGMELGEHMTSTEQRLGEVTYEPEAVTITDSWLRPRKLRSWLGRRSHSDYGLAYDRVMFAPIFTDTALGVPNAGLRFRYNRGASRPDRLESLWARAGKGPGPETNLDVLDSVFRTELGSARGVIITELSMRSLDPERAPNTTGFGDMVVGGKTLIMDGTCTKLSSIFLTHLNTGPVDNGLGTGHVSLEPGLLAMHQWSERTCLHGALHYRIPIAGTRGFAGDVLTTSWAASTVWQDSDAYAWMPVLEFQTHSFLFGAQTEPDGSTRRVNGTTAFDILPGSRFAFGRSALGPCELGISAGCRCSDADWFDSRMMFDIRWLR